MANKRKETEARAKLLSIKIPTARFQALKTLSESTGYSVNDLINQAIQDFLDAQGVQSKEIENFTPAEKYFPEVEQLAFALGVSYDGLLELMVQNVVNRCKCALDGEDDE